MLVYIHVPFCISRCTYCAFHSITMEKGNAGLVESYLDTLFMEIALAGEKHSGSEIKSIFLGGGTPSLLSPSAIYAILNRLSGAFKLSPKAEITLEANPESLKKRNIFSDYLSSGINRLSIGVQSLDDAILKTLGRIHKTRDSVNAIMGARAAGFTNIGVDLIWGLPGQSIRQWLQTLKEATQLGPDHISAYNLTLEPGTILEKKWEAGEIVLPPERDQSLMFMEGSSLLEANGYMQYEISNYAKMGFQSRHNMGYWEGRDYLGLGPSATSTIGDLRWTNPADLKAWNSVIEKRGMGRLPEKLTPRTRILETVMLRLRTARGLKLKTYREMTGHDLVRDFHTLVETMHNNGLIRIRDGHLSLTRKGMLVSNVIIGNLFERIAETLQKNPEMEKNLIPKLPVPPSAPAIPRPIVWPVAENNGAK